MKQPVAALYSVGRTPVLVEAAVDLRDRLGWAPRYWITQPELEDSVQQNFPEAILHDFSEGNRGVNDPVDAALLADMDPTALLNDGLLLRQGLEIIARHVLGGAMTQDQQFNFLIDRLRYAMGVTLALDLQVFVLNSSPHCPIDFSFYMAFRLLNRSVRIAHLTGFRGLQVVKSQADAPPLGIAGLSDTALPEVSAAGIAEFDELAAAHADNKPWYVTRQDDIEKKHAHLNQIADKVIAEGRYEPGQVSFDSTVKLSAQKLGTTNAMALEDPIKRRFQDKHDEPMRRSFAYRNEGFSGPPITWRHYYTYRDWALLSKRRWLHEYEEKAADFDVEKHLSKPFVLFALQYQPERTTAPEGGVFSDQLLAIRMICDALPEGWRLLVKEHPSQFRWQTEGELGRWDGYYDQLQQLGPVDFVGLDVSAARLSQSAQAVVTITGTIGWEAAASGIPVITLAEPWFAAEGVTLLARTTEEVRSSFATIQSGWKPQPDAIMKHLSRIEKLGRRCCLTPSHSPLYEDLSEAENKANVVDLFETAEYHARLGPCA